MKYSQNGYSAARTAIASYTIPTTGVRIALRKGDVSVVLLWLLEQYHKTVEPLRQIDTGGYAERVVRGGVSLSNHASGTAADTRWQKHPLGASNTFTPQQVVAIRRILTMLDGVVRWGGDYSKRKDEMHFEIVGSPERVKRVADRIRNGQIGGNGVPRKPTNKSAYPAYPGSPLKRGMMNNPGVLLAQRKMKARGWRRMSVDGDFGAVTEDLVKQFQREKHLRPDGIIGPKTWKAMFTSP